MKEITIDGRKLLYKVESESSGDYGVYVYTDFYDTRTEVVRKRKYWIFGPYIERVQNVFLFRIWSDANDPNITAEMWREKIRRQLDILKRREEIESGMLI